MFSTWLFQDETSGAMCIDMVMCSMNLVGVGFIPMADDHSIPTLLDEIDLDTKYPTCLSVIVCPSLAMLNCSYLVCLPRHVLYVLYSH